MPTREKIRLIHITRTELIDAFLAVHGITPAMIRSFSYDETRDLLTVELKREPN